MQADDDALVAALRRGDEAAFRHAVELYHAPLVRAARQFVRTTALAEEVTQDTWLAVIRGLDRFEGRSSFKTWLFRILANQARSRAVRESRTVPMSSLASADGPSVDPARFQDSNARDPGHWRAAPADWSGLPESALEAAETRTVIECAIAFLPSSQREVITLRDVVGLAADEVCQVLDVTEGNQRVLLHRARASVRSALEAHLEGIAAS